ncbi:MAG: DUF116 domain-containing protein [Candidatus Altiarchaeota archaeon]
MDFTALMNEPNGMVLLLALFLGGLLLLAGLLAVVLTIMGLALALVFFKTRQIIIPETTLFILNLLEVPIRYMLWVMGIEEDIVSRMIVEVRNALYRDRFAGTPYAERAVFIPQCLRSPNCPAPLTAEGIRCLNCGRCGIGKIKEEAESLGYMFFLAPGGSLVKRMVKKYRPNAVLGVGCPMEVVEGTAKMAAYGLPVQGVLLERDGCVDTRIDVVKLMEKLKSDKSHGRYSIEKDPDLLRKAVQISQLWGGGKPSDVEVVSAKNTNKGGKW